MTLGTQQRYQRTTFGTNLQMFLSGQGRPRTWTLEHLWRDLKIPLHSPSNLMERERFCKEEWKKHPKIGMPSLLHYTHKANKTKQNKTKTWGGNCCSSCASKILSNGQWILVYILYFCFLFLINLKEFQANFFHFFIKGIVYRTLIELCGGNLFWNMAVTWHNVEQLKPYEYFLDAQCKEIRKLLFSSLFIVSSCIQGQTWLGDCCAFWGSCCRM